MNSLAAGYCAVFLGKRIFADTLADILVDALR